MSILGKLVCFVTRKHRRGRMQLMNHAYSIETVALRGVDVAPGHKLMQCPRCGATWVRPIKKETK